MNNKRMKDLIVKMEEINEISFEKKTIKENEDIIKKRADRFRKLAFYNENANLYGNMGSVPLGGVGKTVNSAFENNNESAKYSHQFQTISANLLPKEAFFIAIKRTLDSGAPINNISFYDEVNWHLNKLGFNAKLALDIKNAIKDLMEYGEIRN